MSEQRRPIKRDSYGQLVNRDDYPEELDLLIYVESIEHMPEDKTYMAIVTDILEIVFPTEVGEEQNET